MPARRHVLVLALSLPVSALGLGPIPARAAELTTIRIAISPSDADTAPLLYAKGAGMFAHAGLDVEIQRLGSGAAIAAAVAGGSVDIGKSNLLSLINAHQHGIPFSMIAAGSLYEVKAPYDGLVVAKDTAIVTGADLNGKTISTQSLNDIGQVAASAWVDQHGGNSKTLHFVEIPALTPGLASNAIESHRVDATILTQPILDLAMADGKLRVLGPAFGAIAPAFLFAGWFATNDFTAQHLDVVRKFVATIYQAATFTNTHRPEASRVVAEQIKLPVSDVLNAQWTAAASALDLSQIQPVIDMAAKYGTIAKPFAARELVFPALLQR